MFFDYDECTYLSVKDREYENSLVLTGHWLFGSMPFQHRPNYFMFRIILYGCAISAHLFVRSKYNRPDIAR